jgi:hypothetical protein
MVDYNVHGALSAKKMCTRFAKGHSLRLFLLDHIPGFSLRIKVKAGAARDLFIRLRHFKFDKFES